MRPGILLIGAGGHCRSCIEVIESIDAYTVAGIVGRSEEVGQSVLGYPVVGTDSDLEVLRGICGRALVSIGQIKSAAVRIQAYQMLKSLDFEMPVIVSSSAVVSRHSALGDGTILMHGTIVNAGVRVGANTILNSRVLIEHDVQVGDNCHISTGAIVNGGTTIGSNCFIGSGAVIHQGITIGAGSVIGARTLVVRDLAENTRLREEA